MAKARTVRIGQSRNLDEEMLPVGNEGAGLGGEHPVAHHPLAADAGLGDGIDGRVGPQQPFGPQLPRPRPRPVQPRPEGEDDAGAFRGPRLERANDALGRTLVAGTFRPRTRATQARQEVMASIDRLGLRPLVAEVLGGAPTTKVVRLRLIHWDAVTEAVAALRTHAITSRHADRELWGQQGRTAEEAARVGPVPRAVR